MLVTKKEAIERGINLKTWLSAMQRAAKSPEAPILTVKGPMKLKVRTRAFAGRTASTTTSWTFVGDEAFRIASVYTEQDMRKDAVLIGMSFTPVDTDLAGQISGITMPMAEAIEAFDGLEQFVNFIAAQPDAVSDRGALASRPPAPEYKPRPDTPERGSW